MRLRNSALRTCAPSPCEFSSHRCHPSNGRKTNPSNSMMGGWLQSAESDPSVSFSVTWHLEFSAPGLRTSVITTPFQATNRIRNAVTVLRAGQCHCHVVGQLRVLFSLPGGSEFKEPPSDTRNFFVPLRRICELPTD